MKVLYIDCGMGAAGDMLMAALMELSNDSMLEKLNDLQIPHVEFIKENTSKCGIHGTHMKVLVHGHEELEHHHAHGHHLHDIEHIVSHMKIDSDVKKDIMNVYTLLAQAESEAHNCPITDIHFHEVGTLDAIADISSVCYLIHELNIDCIVTSAIHVGSGSVKCAHGMLPVPAPATAAILKGVPIYSTGIKGELCTPTGAALLKYFSSSFGDMPMMNVEKIGRGMGTKDFERANMVTMYLGQTDTSTNEVVELICNIDDMSAEKISFAMDMLFEAGALDVYTTPIIMKKSRPAVKLSVLCTEKRKDSIIQCIFENTSTIGIRENRMKRYTLDRKIDTVNTQYGSVRVKKSSGYGVQKQKYEFEDIAKIARENHISIEQVEKELK